ncbi:MAG TPA: TorF family putative porin [Burkholderiaceae bacterium]|nr:TorF family putative porin [Burkholderiaceae bacterium]
MSRRKEKAPALGVVAVLALGVILGPSTRAQVSGSATAVSDYRFRGVSLSDGAPAGQADLNYDNPVGWYSGAFLATTRLGAQPRALLQWLPYGGFARRLESGASVDLGASYSGFTGGNRLGYFEANAGITSDDLSFRLNYSPNYFRGDVRTLYAQIDGSHSLGGTVRLVAHLGDLQLLTGPPSDEDAIRRQLDVRAGLVARWSSVTASLSWVSANRVASVYPIQNYYGSINGAHSVWVLQCSVSF